MVKFPAGRETVVGIDPGGTTGWAIYGGEGVFEAGQIPGLYDLYGWVDGLIELGHPLQFVVERFVITPATPKMSQQPDALYIIGTLGYLSHKLGIPMTLQSPADAKAFCSDERLRRLGWYKPGIPHGMDAARHIALFLAHQGDPYLLKAIIHA